MFPYPKDKDIISNALETADKEFSNSTFYLDQNLKQNVISWWNRFEPSDGSIFQYFGNIKKEFYESNEEEIIGEFDCKYVSCYDPVSNRMIDVYEAADDLSGDLEEAISALMKNGEIKEEFQFINGILHIQRFYLNPNYRGKRLGYLIFPAMIDLVQKNNNIVITIIPEPIHDMIDVRSLSEEDVELFKKKNQYKKALKHMEQFLKDFGFRKMPMSKTWVLLIE